MILDDLVSLDYAPFIFNSVSPSCSSKCSLRVWDWAWGHLLQQGTGRGHNAEVPRGKGSQECGRTWGGWNGWHLVKAGREDGVELERARKELRFYAKCNRRTERLYTGERCGLVWIFQGQLLLLSGESLCRTKREQEVQCVMLSVWRRWQWRRDEALCDVQEVKSADGWRWGHRV